MNFHIFLGCSLLTAIAGDISLFGGAQHTQMAAVLVKMVNSFLSSDAPQRDALNNITTPAFQHYGPSIGSCFVPLLKPDEQVLVTFHPQQIVLTSVLQDTKSPLENIASFHMSNKIIAFNTVKPAGLDTHWLLVLTEVNEFHVLAVKYVDDIDLIVIKTFNFYDRLIKDVDVIDHEFRERIVNTQKCFVKVDQIGRFIMINCSTRYVIVLELNPAKRELFYLASINRPPREVKRNPKLADTKEFRIFEPPQCYRIETDLVIDMELTNDGLDWWLAVVSRGINLDYSLTYYKMVVREELECYQSFSSLTECPNLIIPLDKFFILVYDTYHTICHYPEFGTDFRFNPQVIENKTIEINDYESYAKQNLTANTGRNKFFKSYTFIDDRNILLTTANSEYYKIELDYEFIPWDPPKRKLRSYDLPGDDQLENCLIFRKWEIKAIGSDRDGFSNGLQPDQIFYLPLTKNYLSVNKHSEIATFQLMFDSYSEPKILSESKLNLPITELCVNEESKSDLTPLSLTYTGGDLQRGFLKTPKFELKLKNETMKTFITYSNFIVVLNEAVEFGINAASSHEMTQRIDVYCSNGEYTASYDFEDNISVIAMTKIKDPKAYADDSDELGDIDHSIENSLLVLTSSGNEGDYENVSDFFNRKRTEIMFFTIDPKSGDIRLETMAVLEAKLTAVEPLNGSRFRLWGSWSYFDFALKIYKDSKDSTLQLKLIKLDEKIDVKEVETVSIIKSLKPGYKIMIDPFFGIIVAKEDSSCKLISLKLIFMWSMITSFDVFSEDMIVVGDVLGNVFLTELDYTKSDVPTVKFLSSFNLTYGSIGSISCHTPKAKEGPDSLYDVCTLGTSQGAILTISVADSLENKIIKEKLKYQNRAVLGKGPNFEQVSRKITIKKINLDKCDQLEAYRESQKLLEERYTKITMTTEFEIPETADIPIIHFQDHEYLRSIV